MEHATNVTFTLNIGGMYAIDAKSQLASDAQAFPARCVMLPFVSRVFTEMGAKKQKTNAANDTTTTREYIVQCVKSTTVYRVACLQHARNLNATQQNVNGAAISYSAVDAAKRVVQATGMNVVEVLIAKGFFAKIAKMTSCFFVSFVMNTFVAMNVIKVHID